MTKNERKKNLWYFHHSSQLALLIPFVQQQQKKSIFIRSICAFYLQNEVFPDMMSVFFLLSLLIHSWLVTTAFFISIMMASGDLFLLLNMTYNIYKKKGLKTKWKKKMENEFWEWNEWRCEKICIQENHSDNNTKASFFSSPENFSLFSLAMVFESDMDTYT